MKRTNKTLLCSTLLCLALSFTAYADQDVNIADGPVITEADEVYYVNGSTDKDSLNNIKVSSGNVTVILENVTMNLADWVEAIGVESGANLNLILHGENIIETGWGIIVAYGGTINISGDGSLSIYARNSSAIGNISYDSRGMGDINIQGGELKLVSNNGCGIGSMIKNDGVGKLGNITISGGKILAIGSENCAGIGSGDSSSMCNIYIGGDCDVTASSIDGAGIGTGTLDGAAVENIGSITIGGESNVNAVSYSGAGIGTGDKQDRTLNINVTEKARVYAESYSANSIGDGAESKTDSIVNIDDSADVTMISHRGNTVPDSTAADIIEVKVDSAYLSDTNIHIIGPDDYAEIINLPKDSYSVAKTVKKGEYKIRTIDGESEDVTVDSYSKISLEIDKDKHRYIYVSDRGSDDNLGNTIYSPVKTFNRAYELVDSNGYIVVCSGDIYIDRVPKYGKSVTVTNRDSAYSFEKLSGKVIVNSDSTKFYDKLYVEYLDADLDSTFVSGAVAHNLKLTNGELKHKFSWFDIAKKIRDNYDILPCNKMSANVLKNWIAINPLERHKLFSSIR